MHEDFTVVEGATLTFLGLIIGFTFSMALTRYDQRKNYEEEEANAIGTEYVRADLLPRADAARVRALLLRYLEQRILFYTTRDERELEQVNARTAKLQNELWSAVQVPATAQPTPVMALAVSGMNDVLNSQGYTQAAWLNQDPCRRVEFDDSDRHLLDDACRDWRTKHRCRTWSAYCASAGSCHRVLPDRRHRQPASRRNSRDSPNLEGLAQSLRAQ